MIRASVLAGAAFAVFALPTASYAQTQICVLNSSRLIADSKAGKDMLDKLKNIAEQEGKALDSTRTALKNEQSTLNAKTENLDQAQLAADEALKTAIQSYAQKVGEFQVEAAVAERELLGTEGKARAEFNKAADAPVRTVMKNKGCGAILERAATLLTLDEHDITDAVIAELDKTVTTINVEKVEIELPKQGG